MRRVAATGILGLLLAAVGGLPAVAAPSPPPLAPESPLRITISELLPRAPQPLDAMIVRGTVTNTGTTAVTDIQLRLRVGDEVTTRGALQDADLERPLAVSRNRTATVPSPSSLLPGKRLSFVISTTVQALGLSSVGVYPVDVEARGNAGDGFHPLGLASTWVPYFAGGRVQPTRVAVVWPLVDRPHQLTDGTFAEDDLASTLAAAGRLDRLLSAGMAAATRQCEPSVQPTPTVLPLPGARPPTPARCEPVPVTYAVDPDLVQAAADMTAPYRVLADGKTVPGTGQQAARDWLAKLKRAVPSGALLALPYGDPDVAAMTRGLDSSFKDDISLGIALARTTVAKNLGTPVVETVAWPPAGVVTPDAVELLSRAGARALVLDNSTFGQTEGEPARTPSARTLLPSTIGPTVQGLVADEQLSRLVLGASGLEGGSRLAEQRFLAETAVIALQAPSLSRTLLIAPERRGDLDAAAATASLRDLGRVPWLCPVTLAAVAAESERCVDRPLALTPKAEDRGALRTATAGELSPPYLTQVGEQRDKAAQLTDAVLTDDGSDSEQQEVTQMKAELRRSIARAESSYWREDAAGASRSLARLKQDVRSRVGAIVVRGGQVLLTSSSGSLQVSVENNLAVPVKVRVRFQARTLGLEIASSEEVEVLPRRAVPVSVRATAQKSGQFLVDAVLVDQNGKQFGEASSVTVRSTRYGRLALGLTLAGAGVLVAAAGIRLVRRARHRTTA